MYNDTWLNDWVSTVKQFVTTATGFLVALAAVGASASVLRIQVVTDHIYALVGPHEQRNADNFANNATFGVVLTEAGVLLVDPGGSYKGAALIDEALQTITDKPVKIVINTGGQDHRWLGNSYWKDRGARIIASSAAVEDHKARTDSHFNNLTSLMGEEALAETVAVYANETFARDLDLEFGGQRFEIRHRGPAHTLGDSFVWMPEAGVMFTGDIVYVERMLGIGPAQNSGSWIQVFESMASYNPAIIIPGHGPVTDLSRARAETYDYLVHLRTTIGDILDDDGTIEEGIEIDQSAFQHLAVFEQIAKRNAQAVFMQMEFE